MKKYTAAAICLMSFWMLALLSLPHTLTAQNPIPNPDFEEWSGGEPVGWNTINQTVFGTSFVCVTREQSNPQSGSYCAKIQTVTENIFLVGPVTMPGIVSLGEITLDILNQTGTVNGGVPIDTRPNQLNGWFRYQPGSGDSCIIGIGLSRWNGTGRDTLAYAYQTIGGQTTTWTPFSLPIEYLIWEMPDTMNIMFFSSNLLTGSPVTGSTLWVDKLTMAYGPVKVSSPGTPANFRVIAEQGGRNLRINNPAGLAAELQVYGLNGSCILKTGIREGELAQSIGLPDLPDGIYLARFLLNDGQQSVIKFLLR